MPGRAEAFGFLQRPKPPGSAARNTSVYQPHAHSSRPRCATPSLGFDLPDAIAVRERVRKGTRPNDGLSLDRDCENPGYEGMCCRALNVGAFGFNQR
jgi:hypothetical protein